MSKLFGHHFMLTMLATSSTRVNYKLRMESTSLMNKLLEDSIFSQSKKKTPSIEYIVNKLLGDSVSSLGN